MHVGAFCSLLSNLRLYRRMSADRFSGDLLVKHSRMLISVAAAPRFQDQRSHTGRHTPAPLPRIVGSHFALNDWSGI